MLNSIEKEIFRQITLSDGYISSNALSTICSVSVNTIRKSVGTINDYLADKGCFIDSKISSGYCMVVTDEELGNFYLAKEIENIDRFKYLDVSNLSSAYILLFRLLSSDHEVSLEKMMRILYCSKSTVFRILENVRLICKSFALELKNKRNSGFYIEGNEWSIRNCISLLEKVNTHSEMKFDEPFYFDLLENIRLKTRIRDIIYTTIMQHEQLPFELNQINSHSLTNWVILSHIRQKQNNRFNFSTEVVNLAKQLPTYQVANEIFDNLQAFYPLDYPESEKVAFSAYIACCLSPTKVDDSLKQQFKEEIDELVSFINSYYYLPEFFDEDFYQDFSKYLYSLQLRLKFGFVSDDENLYHSIRMGLFSCDLCGCFALFYKLKHNIILKESDLIGSYYIFNNSCLTHQNLNTFHYNLNAAITARDGYYQAKNVRYRILSQFPNIFARLDILNNGDIYSDKVNQYDLLLTNYKLRENNNLVKYNNDIIFYGHIHAKNSFNSMSLYLKRIILNKAKEIFTEKNLIKTNFTHKEELFDAIYQRYAEHVGDKASFIHDLLLRDSFISFEKTNGIVMMCPMAYKFDQPKFDVFINREPITWKKNKNTVFIFYSRGLGTNEHSAIISFLLKQFLHQQPIFINCLYNKTYRDIIRSFIIQ
ncbi:MAG: BglG family transcription antiterminator [Erysipelotrichaceae bacterium]